MGDEKDLELCRLCLNSGGMLLNIFDENSKLEFMLEKTIEDLLAVKVVEDANYPWLVCSICTEKLTELRLFKRRCAECLFVFYNRIQKGCNPARKDWITNREEFPAEIKEEFGDDEITGDSWMVEVQDDITTVKEENDAVSEHSGANEEAMEFAMVASMKGNDSHYSYYEEAGNWFPAEVKEEFGDEKISSNAIDNRTVDIQDDITIVKEEIDAGNEHSAANEGVVQLEMVTSMKGRDSHYSDNEEAGNLDHSEDFELHLSSQVEEYSKVADDADIPNKQEGLGRKLLQAQGRKESGKIHDEKEKATHTPLHDCQVCHKVFAKRDLLKDHKMQVHVKKGILFRCDICLDVFDCKNSIARHINLVHDLKRKHQCQGSSRKFQKLSIPKTHMSTHREERRLKCDICSKVFAKNAELRRHVLTHTDVRPFKCDTCSKAFVRKDKLKDHMMTHTDERPYMCEICSKTFARNGNLKVHMLTHTAERPFKYEICSQTFTQNSNLKKHMLTHSHEKIIQAFDMLKTICSKEAPFGTC